jgi:hypothetical protein
MDDAGNDGARHAAEQALSQKLHIRNAILEICCGLIRSTISNCTEGVMSDKQKKKIKSLKKEVKELKSQLKKFKLTSAVKKNSRLKAAISASTPPAMPTLVTKPDKAAETAVRR